MTSFEAPYKGESYARRKQSSTLSMVPDQHVIPDRGPGDGVFVRVSLTNDSAKARGLGSPERNAGKLIQSSLTPEPPVFSKSIHFAVVRRGNYPYRINLEIFEALSTNYLCSPCVLSRMNKSFS